MLGRKAGQCSDLEGGEVGDLLFPVGQTLPEFGDVVLEPDDLGCTRVG
jgi:hypothetical protein